jgi:hypothetical protein
MYRKPADFAERLASAITGQVFGCASGAGWAMERIASWSIDGLLMDRIRQSNDATIVPGAVFAAN